MSNVGLIIGRKYLVRWKNHPGWDDQEEQTPFEGVFKGPGPAHKRTTDLVFVTRTGDVTLAIVQVVGYEELV